MYQGVEEACIDAHELPPCRAWLVETAVVCEDRSVVLFLLRDDDVVDEVRRDRCS